MKVLVPTDGSEHAMKAVSRALELAQKEGAEITLMAVAHYAKDDIDDMPPNIQDKLEAEAAAALKKAKAIFEEKGLKVEVIFEAGVVPANNIIAQAKKGKYDRILMGSSGRTGLDLAFVGSTAAKIVAQAPCSVTIIK